MTMPSPGEPSDTADRGQREIVAVSSDTPVMSRGVVIPGPRHCPPGRTACG
ncbi:hypothetical protein QFZ82_004208 [Streptomyces sp. V4I23]|nr:hypothetical protein [Streptomyces sp. V4I23]